MIGVKRKVTKPQLKIEHGLGGSSGLAWKKSRQAWPVKIGITQHQSVGRMMLASIRMEMYLLIFVISAPDPIS